MLTHFWELDGDWLTEGDETASLIGCLGLVGDAILDCDALWENFSLSAATFSVLGGGGEGFLYCGGKTCSLLGQKKGIVFGKQKDKTKRNPLILFSKSIMKQ